MRSRAAFGLSRCATQKALRRRALRAGCHVAHIGFRRSAPDAERVHGGREALAERLPTGSVAVLASEEVMVVESAAVGQRGDGIGVRHSGIIPDFSPRNVAAVCTAPGRPRRVPVRVRAGRPEYADGMHENRCHSWGFVPSMAARRAGYDGHTFSASVHNLPPA